MPQWICTGLWRRNKHPIPKTRQELERTTDVCFEEITMEPDDDGQGNESCLTEGDKFVGTTAKFSADWDIISLRPDLRLAG